MKKIFTVILLLLFTMSAYADPPSSGIVTNEALTTDNFHWGYIVRGSYNWDDRLNLVIASVDSTVQQVSQDSVSIDAILQRLTAESISFDLLEVNHMTADSINTDYISVSQDLTVYGKAYLPDHVSQDAGYLTLVNVSGDLHVGINDFFVDDSEGMVGVNAAPIVTLDVVGQARITNNTTNNGLRLNQTGVLATGNHALYITNGAAAGQTNETLVHFYDLDTDSDKYVLEISCAGPGKGIYVNGSKAGTYAASVRSTAGGGLSIQQVDADSEIGLYVYSSTAQTTNPLVFILQDNVASNENCLEIDNDGTGYSIEVQSGDVYLGNSMLRLSADTASPDATSTPGLYTSIDAGGNFSHLIYYDGQNWYRVSMDLQTTLGVGK